MMKSVYPLQAVCHCFLIESNDGLILVDTGIGEHDFENRNRLGFSSVVLGLSRDKSEAAVNQVKALGYSVDDVRHIIPTHLDYDHAGGISDFPNATVHTLRSEYEAATGRLSFVEAQRYRQKQWRSHSKWAIHDEKFGESWLGFDAVREIPGLPPEILLIPLFGHTAGHFGVAVQTSSGWLLHVGDAYYDHRELEVLDSPPLSLSLLQRLLHGNFYLALGNQRKLKELSQNHPEVNIVCSHDPKEFESCVSGAQKP